MKKLMFRGATICCIRMSQFRNTAGMTQKEQGEEIGLKQQLIAAYERGTRRFLLLCLNPYVGRCMFQ
jgi:DNA-binding XRE family transcriptional regulator